MSRRTVYTCDNCGNEFKTVRSGGKTSDVVLAYYEVPPTIFTVTDTRGDTYDYCSKDCLAIGMGVY